MPTTMTTMRDGNLTQFRLAKANWTIAAAQTHTECCSNNNSNDKQAVSNSKIHSENWEMGISLQSQMGKVFLETARGGGGWSTNIGSLLQRSSNSSAIECKGSTEKAQGGNRPTVDS